MFTGKHLSLLHMAFTLLSKRNGHISLIVTGSWHMVRPLSRHPATTHTLMPQPSLWSSPSKIRWYMLHGQHAIEVHEITYGWLARTMTFYYIAERMTEVIQLQKFRIKSCMVLPIIYQLFVMMRFTTHNLLFSLSPAVDLHVKKKKKLDLATLFPYTHSTSFPSSFFSTWNSERISYFSLLYRNLQYSGKYQVWEGKFPQKYNKLVWCLKHISLQSCWRLHQDFFSALKMLCRILSCRNDRTLFKCYLTRTYHTAQANRYLLYLHVKRTPNWFVGFFSGSCSKCYTLSYSYRMQKAILLLAHKYLLFKLLFRPEVLQTEFFLISWRSRNHNTSNEIVNEPKSSSSSKSTISLTCFLIWRTWEQQQPQHVSHSHTISFYEIINYNRVSTCL